MPRAARRLRKTSGAQDADGSDRTLAPTCWRRRHWGGQSSWRHWSQCQDRGQPFHHWSEPVTYPVAPPRATVVQVPVVWFQAAAVPLLFTTTKLPPDPAMSPKALPKATVAHVRVVSLQAAAVPPLFATTKLPPDPAKPPKALPRATWVQVLALQRHLGLTPSRRSVKLHGVIEWRWAGDNRIASNSWPNHHGCGCSGHATAAG